MHEKEPSRPPGGASPGRPGGSAGDPAPMSSPSARERYGSSRAAGGAGPRAALGAGLSGVAAAAQERINRGIREAADRIEGAAHRLDEVVGERLDGAEGPVARAGEAGHSLADGLESVAGYLRSKDVETVGRDLARQARERPVRTLLVGLAAGWLLGKITR